MELNQNFNPDIYLSQAPGPIPKDLPLVLLPNTHCCHSLVQQRAGRVGSPAWASGNMGGVVRREKRNGTQIDLGFIK